MHFSTFCCFLLLKPTQAQAANPHGNTGRCGFLLVGCNPVNCSSRHSLVWSLHVHQPVLSPADWFVNCHLGSCHLASQLNEVPSLWQTTEVLVEHRPHLISIQGARKAWCNCEVHGMAARLPATHLPDNRASLFDPNQHAEVQLPAVWVGCTLASITTFLHVQRTYNTHIRRGLQAAVLRGCFSCSAGTTAVLSWRGCSHRRTACPACCHGQRTVPRRDLTSVQPCCC